MIRDARQTDLPFLLSIVNDVILSSTAIYRDEPETIDDRRQWFDGRQKSGYPVLVAEEENRVIGFATFGDFRPWPGYRFTVEHSVHIDRNHRGKGHGRALVEALMPRASACDKHVMIAGIDADNAASIVLHERLGFERAAHFREVGFKFGRWLDLVFMQKRLG